MRRLRALLFPILASGLAATGLVRAQGHAARAHTEKEQTDDDERDGRELKGKKKGRHKSGEVRRARPSPGVPPPHRPRRVLVVEERHRIVRVIHERYRERVQRLWVERVAVSERQRRGEAASSLWGTWYPAAALPPSGATEPQPYADTTDASLSSSRASCAAQPIETTPLSLPPGASTKVFFLGLSSEILDESAEKALGEILAAGVRLPAQASLVTMEDVNAALEAEKLKDLVGSEDVESLSAIGDAIGADLVMSATIERADDAFVLSLRVVKPGTVDRLAAVSSRYREPVCAAPEVERAARTIVQPSP